MFLEKALLLDSTTVGDRKGMSRVRRCFGSLEVIKGNLQRTTYQNVLTLTMPGRHPQTVPCARQGIYIFAVLWSRDNLLFVRMSLEESGIHMSGAGWRRVLQICRVKWRYSTYLLSSDSSVSLSLTMVADVSVLAWGLLLALPKRFMVPNVQ